MLKMCKNQRRPQVEARTISTFKIMGPIPLVRIFMPWEARIQPCLVSMTAPPQDSTQPDSQPRLIVSFPEWLQGR